VPLCGLGVMSATATDVSTFLYFFTFFLFLFLSFFLLYFNARLPSMNATTPCPRRLPLPRAPPPRGISTQLRGSPAVCSRQVPRRAGPALNPRIGPANPFSPPPSFSCPRPRARAPSRL
jgi:hypothetical protein